MRFLKMLDNGKDLGILKNLKTKLCIKRFKVESKQTRETAGILDGSTLGKIEIKGKDALEFMNLMYTNAFTKMKPMTSRYALMLGEDGMIMDDGIVCKINDKHFIATTTSSGAPKVLSHMEEFLQTEWPHLQVYLNSITEQFTTFNISGPKSKRNN